MIRECLYYAPQGWTSDDTDAAERVKDPVWNQHVLSGKFYGKPRFGSSESSVKPKSHHCILGANVAYFGTFGYELDLNKLTDEEIAEVKAQIFKESESLSNLETSTDLRVRLTEMRQCGSSPAGLDPDLIK